MLSGRSSARIFWMGNTRLQLPQTDPHSQFWFLHEDIDQPRNTSFGSVQRSDWRTASDAEIRLDRCRWPAVLNVPSKLLDPIAAVRSRKPIHASVVLGVFDADEN